MSRDTEHEHAAKSGEKRVEEVRAAFEQAWRSGQGPRIRDYLAKAGDDEATKLLRALIATEVHLRRQSGQTIDSAGYEAEFPGRSVEVTAAFTLADELGRAAAAEKLYGEFVRRHNSGEIKDFSAWCESHPEFADQMQRLHGQNDTVQYSDSPDEVADFSLKGSFAPGRESNSRYSVRERLAQGGMGVVYKVWDGNLNRELAMKLIREKVRPDDTTRNADLDIEKLGRFIREAEITAKLDHPGVVPIHDMGTDARGRIYFTMRLVQGRRLDAVFKLAQQRREGWSQTRALDVIVKICETLAFAHSRGVIHRDLKPTNIMVGQFGETYVMDWGLAKNVRAPGEPAPEPLPSETECPEDKELLDATIQDSNPTFAFETRDGDVMGTAAYMSPEQAAGRIEEVDALSDIYSTGAILYELLTGQRPYMVPGVRVDAQTIITYVVERPPVSILRLSRNVPAELVAICDKAMARNRALRYSSMAEMAADLRAYLENRVVRAYQTGAMAELRKWMKRNRGTAIASALVVLVAVGGLSAVIGIQSWAYSELSEASTKVQNAFGRLKEETNAKEKALKDEILSRQIAEKERQRAEALFLARVSTDVAATNPEQALLLARESAKWHSGFAVRSAFLTALDYYRPVRELTGHRDEIMTSAVSPDGTRAVTASQDNTAIVWDVASGKPLWWLIGHQNFVRAARFSSDGRLVVTGSYDKTAAVWDSHTGERLQILSGSGGIIWEAAFSSDNRHVATGALDGSVTLWDVSTGRPTRTFPGHTADVVALQFSPSGRWLATGSADGTARVWNVDTGAEVARLGGHGSLIRSVRFSPDEKRLLTTVGHSRPGLLPENADSGEAPAESAARLWDTETWQAAILPHPLLVDAAAFSRDGLRLGTATSDGAIRIWSVATKAIERTIQTTDGVIESLSFCPAGRLIVAGTTRGAITLWDTRSGRSSGRLSGHSMSVAHVHFCSANVLFSAARDRTARIWSLEGSGVIRSDESPDQETDANLEISPEGNLLALRRRGSGRISLCSLPDGQNLAQIECPAAVRSLRFSPDGKWLGVLADAGEVSVYATSDGHQQLTVDSSTAASDFVFTSAGRIVVACAESGTVKVGDVATATFEAPLVFPGMRFLLVAPDGRSLLSWPRNSPNAELWDLDIPKLTALIPVIAEGSQDFPSFAFSPGGDVLTARVLHWGAPVRWNVRTGEPLGGLAEEGQSVRSLGFASQGDAFVTLSLDWVPRVWEGSTGRLISLLAGHEPTNSILAVGPDATRLITQSIDRQARLWNGRTGKSISLLGNRDDPLSTAKFSRDGSLLLALNADGNRILLWDAVTGERLAAVTSPRAEFSDAAFTPDARWFVTAHRDGSARIRPVVPEESARQLELRVLTPHERELFHIGTSEERAGHRREWIEKTLGEQLDLAGRIPVKSAEQARFAEDHAKFQLEQFLEGLSDDSPREAKAQALKQLEDSLRQASKLSPPVAVAFSKLYRQQNDDSRAELVLRYALTRNEACDSAVWNSWAVCCLGKLGRSPRELLDDFPSHESTEAADLVWLLQRLRAGEPIRIHAGGSGLTTADGADWRRDCFFGGGFRFNESFGGSPESSDPIANTSESRLYQSERWFDRDAPREQRCYFIPLPSGRFEVRLHFAEIHFREPEHRVMDVLAEGQTVLAAYDPGSAGFATADQRRFQVEVTDGLLEIEFRGVLHNPKISAIEISRLAD